MRLTGVTLSCALAIALSIASPASAQVTQKEWYCVADKMSGTCNGQADCDAKWAQHLIARHAGGTPTGPVTPHRPRSAAESVIVGTLSISAVTSLVSSLGTRDGVNQWKNGAIGGAGGGAAIAVAANANRIPVVVGAAIATAGGAVAGKQVGDFQVSQGKEETNARDIKIGAAAGFATWAVGKLAIGPASPNLAPRWMGPKSKLNFILTGRWLGVIARW